MTVTVSPQQGKDPGSAGQNSKKTETRPTEQKPAGPQFDQSVFVTSFDPATRKTLVIVQRPKEFVPSHITGHGAADIKLMDMHWATWDRNEARGNCSAYVTGGGADPETIKGARIFFSKAQYKDGKLQYTHYRLEFPDGTVNDRDLEFNVD